MTDQAEKLRQLVSATTAGTTAAAAPSPSDSAEKATLPAPSAVDECGPGAAALLFTSGKGGVGTSNLVLNLAIALGEMEQRVLVFDGDIGLANLDLLGGLAPQYDLGDVLQGRCELADVVVTGPAGIQVVPGAHAMRIDVSELADGAERLAPR